MFNSSAIMAPTIPRLDPTSLFLWGWLEDRVFVTAWQIVDKMKQQITEEFQQISVQTLRNVFQNMVCQVDLCLREKGDYFQHLLQIIYVNSDQIKLLLLFLEYIIFMWIA